MNYSWELPYNYSNVYSSLRTAGMEVFSIVETLNHRFQNHFP